SFPELAKFDQPSVKFLRYLESRLSKEKADHAHKVSLKSCMLRIPGSYNSKCILSGCPETEVKILQEWDGIRSRASMRLYYDFRAHLVNERIKEIRLLQRKSKKWKHNGG